MKLAIKYQNWIIRVYLIGLILLSIVSFNGTLALDRRHLIGIRIDYIIHAIFFVPWMILANLRWNQSNKCKVFWWLLGIGFILATVSEIVQLLIPKKTFNLIDLIANGVGIVIGAMIWIVLSSLARYPKKS